MGVSCFVGAVRSVEGSPIVPFLVVGKDCFIAGGACSCIIPSFEINSLLEKILRGNSPPGFSAWVMSYDQFYCGETFHLWLSISLFGSLCTPIFSSSSHCAGKSCYILLGNSPNGARGPRLRRWLEPMAGRAVRGSRGLRQVQLWWFQSDSEEDKVQRRQSCKWYENTLNHLNHLNHLSRTTCSIQFFGDASAGLLGVLAARTALRARKSQGGPAVPVFQGDKS